MSEEEVLVPSPTGPIKTVGDMMAALETELQDVKSGALDDSKARHVLKFRNAQLKTAELQLQYSRIFKGRVPDPEMRLLNSPPQSDPGEPLSAEERAQLARLKQRASEA